MKLSPQQQIIVDKLRCMNWVCSSEFGYIKDDRRRITDLNRGYMKDKGYQIVGKRCDGRCGKNHSSTLFMRRAEPIKTPSKITQDARKPSETALAMNREALKFFDSYKKKV